MTRTPYTPWHEVVTLRDDLRSGDLALSIFAADLYDVAMGTGRPVYLDPKEFFSLTYPTYNLREMAKDVLLRLAGKNDKAVRQLELTYGGGKTHSLITLYHLVNEPAQLPDLPAVQEFRQHAGGTIPSKARIAVLAFDKLDIEKGMEVRAPDVGVLTDAAILSPPPPDIPATAVLPQNLQDAWIHEATTAAAIASALSAAIGKQLPWQIVATAIDGAIRGRLVERTEESGPWPCEWPSAANVLLRIPAQIQPPPIPAPPPGRPSYRRTEATLEPNELQDLADGLGDILKAGAGLNLRFVLRVELEEETVASDLIAKLNDVLAKVSKKLRLE